MKRTKRTQRLYTNNSATGTQLTVGTAGIGGGSGALVKNGAGALVLGTATATPAPDLVAVN